MLKEARRSGTTVTKIYRNVNDFEFESIDAGRGSLIFGRLSQRYTLTLTILNLSQWMLKEAR